jgi:hypothetical protein
MEKTRLFFLFFYNWCSWWWRRLAVNVIYDLWKWLIIRVAMYAMRIMISKLDKFLRSKFLKTALISLIYTHLLSNIATFVKIENRLNFELANLFMLPNNRKPLGLLGLRQLLVLIRKHMAHINYDPSDHIIVKSVIIL